MISPTHRPLTDNTQYSQQLDTHRNTLYKWSDRRTEIYLTSHNNQTNRHPYDSSVQRISLSHRPLTDNKLQSQQTNIHTTTLYKGSARRTNLYMTTHTTQNRKTTIELLCTRVQHVAQTSTWQHITIKTDRHPYYFSVHVISPSHRPLPDNTQQSQRTDTHWTPLYKGSARRTDLYLTTHNTHNRQTSIGLLCTSDQLVADTST